jgi:thymidylate synthase
MNVMNAWKDSLERIQAQGFSFTDDEQRQCHEAENFTVTITDLSDVETPLQWVRAQSKWYYPTNEELKQTLFSTQEETGRYSYGARIFSFQSKKNQLDEYVIPLLQEHPQTRRALVVLADPIVDAQSERNFVSLLSVWFRIIDSKVCVTAVLRSNDFLLGWPANIYQTHLLQKYVADALGLACGSVTSLSLSAHYFSDEKWLLDKLLKD